MVDTIHAILNGLTIDGATPDSDGILWSVKTIDGWYNSIPSTVVLGDAAPVGEVLVDVRLKSRAIVLEAIAFRGTHRQTVPLGDDCFLAIERIQREAAAEFASVLLKVNDPVRALQARVRLTPPLRTSIDGELGVVIANIPLLAPDPRRYSQNATTGIYTLTGTATNTTGNVTNNGTIDAPWSVSISGPAVNPYLRNTSLSGQPYVRWFGTVPSGQNLVIDSAAATLLLNGVDVRGNMDPDSRFFGLIPGVNGLQFHRTSGATTSVATVTYRDAYR